MKPLLILIPFIVAVSHGKPGGSYSYPAPTPSAPPAIISNLGTPSPSIAPSVYNLQAPTASVAPQVFLPSPTSSLTPSAFNFGTPSIAPSLLVENVLGAGQYAPSFVNIGSQPLGYQPIGDQSLNLGLSQFQFGLPLYNEGLNFGQSGQNFGEQLLSIGSPQLSLGSPQLSVNAPDITSAQLNPVGPTISSSNIDLRGSNVQTAGGGVVQKHVYVHVAPEEFNERPPPRQIVAPPPRKRYNIIFIKAPSPPAPKAPIVPPSVQDEEKTVVYVLVKTPEEQPEIKIQTPPPTPPSKPEVYFIGYNTKKESIAGGTIRSGPTSIDSRIADVPIVEDVVKEVSLPSIDSRIADIPIVEDVVKEVSLPSIDSRIADIPIVEDVVKEVSDTTSPTVSIGDSTSRSGLHTSVDLNLNKASLSGGSALSLAVTGSPLDSTLHVSSTPPTTYGPLEDN